MLWTSLHQAQAEQALKRKEGEVEQTLKGWWEQDKACHSDICNHFSAWGCKIETYVVKLYLHGSHKTWGSMFYWVFIHDMYMYMKMIILSRAEGGCHQGITLQVIHTHIILSMPRWHIRPLQKQSTRQLPISGSDSRSSQTCLIPFLLNFFSPYDSFSLPLFLFPVGVYLMTTLGIACMTGALWGKRGERRAECDTSAKRETRGREK